MTSQRGGVSNLRGWHRAGLVKGFLVSLHSGHAPKSDYFSSFKDLMAASLNHSESFLLARFAAALDATAIFIGILIVMHLVLFMGLLNSPKCYPWSIKKL